MLSNILFRFSTDGNRGAAFSAEVLRKGCRPFALKIQKGPESSKFLVLFPYGQFYFNLRDFLTISSDILRFSVI